MKIAILGAGAFGTALGGILAEKGYDIDYYDSKVEREALSSVLLNTKIIVLAVPSKAAPYLLPYLPKHLPLIVATKGILGAKPFTEFKDWMVLSGPGFAADIKNHQKTKLTATDPRIDTLFETPYLSFDHTSDKTGVLLCGALKNVYAIQAGLLNLKSGSPLRTDYLKSALAEMKAILAANSAEEATANLVCGQGDLDLTCALPSRNFEFGLALCENPHLSPEIEQKTIEGLSALRRIKRGEIRLPGSIPLLENLIKISKTWN